MPGVHVCNDAVHARPNREDWIGEGEGTSGVDEGEVGGDVGLEVAVAGLGGLGEEDVWRRGVREA